MRWRIKTILPVLALTLCCQSCAWLMPYKPPPDLPKALAEYLERGKESPLELKLAIIDYIEKDPGSASAYLRSGIKNAAGDHELVVYIWAAGFTGDESFVAPLTEIADIASMEVRVSAYRAMAAIGGERAGEYLLARARERDAQEASLSRYAILNMLASMQYEPALPLMEELLERDFKQYFWQLYFCFGKMGQRAAPLLLSKLADEREQVRFNAVYTLGHVLLHKGASEPLRDRYWGGESSPLVKKMILSCVEKVEPDLSVMAGFLRRVVSEEQDPTLRNFAAEGMVNVNHYRMFAGTNKKEKKQDEEALAALYGGLYRSAGTKGPDPGELRFYTTAAHEEKLLALRRRMLERNTLKSIEDFLKVNDVIFLNRIIAANQ